MTLIKTNNRIKNYKNIKNHIVINNFHYYKIMKIKIKNDIKYKIYSKNKKYLT